MPTTELAKDLGPERRQMRAFYVRQFAYDASRAPENNYKMEGKWDATSRRLFDGVFEGPEDVVAAVKNLMME